MIRNLLVVLFVSLFLISCGGGGGGSNNNIPASGLYNAVGTWTVTHNPNINEYGGINCAEPSQYTETYYIEKSGDGFKITFCSESETRCLGPYDLVVNGDTYTYSSSDYYPATNTSFEVVTTVTLTSDDTLTGTESWENVWGDNSDESMYCRGADTLSGIKN